MTWSRRQVLASGLAAGCLALVPAGASAAERHPLAAELREKMLSVDVADFAHRILVEVGIGQRWVREVDELLANRDTKRGVLSIAALFDDEEFSAQANALAERAGRSPCVATRLIHALRRAPQDAEGRQAMLDWIYTAAGLDLNRYREAVAELPATGAIQWGALRDLTMFVGQILREPFELLTSLTLGVRMQSYFADEYPDAFRRFVRLAVDPSVTHLVFAGHGGWSVADMHGRYAHPDRKLAEWCERALHEPKMLLMDLAGADLKKLIDSRVYWDELAEQDLEKLVTALGGGVRKQMVVKYSCGGGRYLAPTRLLWLLLPDEIRENVEVEYRDAGLSGADPRSDYVSSLGRWLAENAPTAVIEENPAFGRSLVASADHTRGYEGPSWIDDFVNDPLPEVVPRASFAVDAAAALAP